MGSIVEYRCGSCTYSSGQMNVGWGKAGRASYWGGLALCEACKELAVVDLADTRVDRRDRRCAKCNGVLKLYEGIAERIRCPQCGNALRFANLGGWS